MEPTEQDTPCRPLDRQGIREAAEIRRSYLRWLAGKMRTEFAGATPDQLVFASAAAEALEQVAS